MEQKLAEYLEMLRGVIAEHGWAVQTIGGNPQEGGFYSYTIGFTETLGHPEVFLAGFDQDLGTRLLNDVGSLIRQGADFREPCLHDRVVRDFDVAFRPVDPGSARRLGNAGRAALGRDFEAVQLFLPDAAGLFPWDEGCDASFAARQTGSIRTFGPVPARHDPFQRRH